MLGTNHKKGLWMTIKPTIIAVAAMGMASQAFAGPLPSTLTAGPEASQAATTHLIGSKKYKRKYYSRDCKPYNGPYGYYGNPYCEGGFDRDGAAGGYEIDLTRYLRDRRYRDDPRY